MLLQFDWLVQLQEQSDVDEMAYNPKGTQDTSGKVVAFRPIFKDGNTSEIPDGFQLNKINLLKIKLLVLLLLQQHNNYVCHQCYFVFYIELYHRCSKN
jgi:hypothetical protein